MRPIQKVLLALALATGTALVVAPFVGRDDSAPLAQPIVIARLPTPHSGLLHIAEAKRYLADEGLRAAMVPVATGAEAIAQVLRGAADVGTTAQTPLARALAEGKHPKVIASIHTSQWNSGLVARKDSGIAQPSDLAGKRIGVVPGTRAHHMLEAFLAFHALAPDAVSTVALEVDDLVDALETGAVDAVITWMPHLARAQERLGSNGLTFSAHSRKLAAFNLVVRPDYLPARRDAVDRLLRALSRAEAFLASHPDQATAIIAAASGMDPRVLARERGQANYGLSLKAALAADLAQEVRWHVERGLVPGGTEPNVAAFEPEPLRALRPGDVTIVR